MPKSDRWYGLRDLVKALKGGKAPVSFPYGCRCGQPVPPLQLPAKYTCPKCKVEYVISDTYASVTRKQRATFGKITPRYCWYSTAYRTSFNVTTCPKCHTGMAQYDWRLPGLDSFQGQCDWECRKCGHREMRDGPDSVC